MLARCTLRLLETPTQCPVSLRTTTQFPQARSYPALRGKLCQTLYRFQHPAGNKHFCGWPRTPSHPCSQLGRNATGPLHQSSPSTAFAALGDCGFADEFPAPQSSESSYEKPRTAPLPVPTWKAPPARPRRCWTASCKTEPCCRRLHNLSIGLAFSPCTAPAMRCALVRPAGSSSSTSSPMVVASSFLERPPSTPNATIPHKFESCAAAARQPPTGKGKGCDRFSLLVVACSCLHDRNSCRPSPSKNDPKPCLAVACPRLRLPPTSPNPPPGGCGFGKVAPAGVPNLCRSMGGRCPISPQRKSTYVASPPLLPGGGVNYERLALSSK